MGRSLHLRRLIVERLGSTTTPTHRAFEFRDKGPRHERAVEKLVDEMFRVVHQMASSVSATKQALGFGDTGAVWSTR